MADLPTLVAMARRFLGSVYAGKLPDNPAQLETFGRGLLTNPASTVWVAEDETPIGLIAMLLYTHPMSGELTATEVVWWVNPERRGVGVRLFKRAEAWARAQGAVLLQMIAPTEAVARFYERCGFDRIETTYHRRLA